MNTIGIIGGFGPEATAIFYLELVKRLSLTNISRQPDIIVRHCPVPEKTLETALLRGKHVKQFAPILLAAAKQLEREGATVIVLPCNTLHTLAPLIEKTISVPFISIIEASVSELQMTGVKRVGLLGTSITCRQNLFAKRDPTITCITPDTPLQHKLDVGIHRFVSTSDAHTLNKALENAVKSLQKQGIHDVLVACTDFHGLCPDFREISYHDTLDNLVTATVMHVLKGGETL